MNYPLIKQLREQGSRITKVRRRLAGIFERHHLPLTEQELRLRLAKAGSIVNKTTIYRELAHLKIKNIIKEVDLDDGKKRFELNFHQHHHHLVCTKCRMIDDIFVHNDVRHVEQKIRKEKKFLIQSHSLEFFGLCKNCH
ncbi:MAG: hypothetical protein A3J07_04350 [Candidatus Doudnabacteria bacterium RIFCSPLOWO2_02_FULL_49_13]|uniref:Transcriptional repressor n=1 Tax=Candidatus Doudnabacteria bacterium RIFCSPHIGHO2_12_FULL_48_16 TaxID=1817838 RepID=A0A1F5PJM5_9BACT|nr:MAG: hypothetical protein A3B77_03215 [Candidatus Doudnabacteria bacterium RIFCSPHIGHO2_02_FULL_49_24]OGE89127.1 MAG: hypothetical protein A2760_04150 [Candidatus Doudnabacteria bacterium RIFCSPHIGHO2_01_FULL_50_67]OGE90143.1 MAG: hypothetical protein A3E29_03490 [Candidatus Doudnabacteria bacterium RIFCSPHIGHO2_12_FULL_48_16]OGE97234.1 MAG: hypothetical protein A2990_01415 [Candidatus Doudnabacteria bacterium RIFCSPLOWO2_01_FULL_49_40]OGF03285.1 MAG: hypothetical protein A3J07_04350 [Candid